LLRKLLGPSVREYPVEKPFGLNSFKNNDNIFSDELEYKKTKLQTNFYSPGYFESNINKNNIKFTFCCRNSK